MKSFEEIISDVNNKELLNEGLAFYQYKALVRVTYTDDPEFNVGAGKIEECLRALPGGTRVSTASLDKANHRGIFNVRLISQKSPKEAFISFKKNCLERFGKIIVKVEVATGSIETKNFMR